MRDWNPPERFDGYQIIRLLGRGGMGEVYVAKDSLLDREVAIKFISAADPNPKSRSRFLTEARAIARLQHPNVVSIYRVGHVQNVPYLVSEFVDGQVLDEHKRPVPWETALSFGMGIARALAAAHQRGVLHRDIKPANVIVCPDGEVKLLDFGIAKMVGTPSCVGVPELDTTQDAISAAEVSTHTSTHISTTPAHVSWSPSQDAPTGSIPCSAPAIHVELNALTEDGYVVGTPGYVAPEVREGHPASFRSDVYSLGVLLYVLCANRLPHVRAEFDDTGKASVIPAEGLASVNASVDPKFAAVVDRCLHPDPGMRYASGNEVRSALAQLTPEARLQEVGEGNPYPGLRAFGTDRAALYFGRDSEIRSVLERVSTEGFVLVAGDAGVGKSSLCRAGVLPRVQRWLDDHRVWTTLTIVPGKSPARVLAGALAEIVKEDVEELERLVTDDPGEIGRFVQMRLGEKRGVVLLVDQLEELVTRCTSAEAACFATALYWLAAAESSVRVLASARSDFLGQLASLPVLGDRVAPALYFLRPLTRERLREAIVAPARSKGVRFEAEAMIEELTSCAHDTGRGLPLLQFALAELWQAKPSHELVISEALFRQLGGAKGALTRHADQVLAGLRVNLRDAAREILRRLVTRKNTSALRTAQELNVADPNMAAALAALVAGRLVIRSDSSAGVTYELVHEALIENWGTLAQILATDVETRALRERLQSAVAEWQRLGRPGSALWSREQLREADALRKVDLSDQDRAFLRRSRRVQTLRIGGAIALVLGIVLAVLGTYGTALRREEARKRSDVDKAVSEARASLESAMKHVRASQELERRAIEHFERRDGSGERVWLEMRKSKMAANSALDKAERHMESAVLRDGSRDDVRGQFADILMFKAARHEADQDPAGRDRALKRTELYDASGERLRNWHRGSEVVIRSDPPGATLSLERYEQDDRGVMRRQPLEGSVPFRLAAGSYRARLQLKGYEPTLFPFEVQRGQDLDRVIKLIPTGGVPDGFVYVPSGIGWFGSDAPDELRQSFFNAEPIHEVRSEGFFIARLETTYEQWLTYLRALPQADRTERLPRVEGGGFNGALRIRSRADGKFVLWWRIGQTGHEAVEGQRLILPKRHRNASLDWGKLPVAGISAKDSVAFAQWLERTGRVPSARLCTEIEWERAARGADRRHYPHGDHLQAEQANTDRTYGKLPDAMASDEVGSFPASQSPFGIEDMVGNAWEWTTSARDPKAFVARGGSFFYDAEAARIENRELPEASFRDVSVGLRLCADLPLAVAP